MKRELSWKKLLPSPQTLSFVGLMLLCLLMFAGRVGLLTLALSLVDGRAQPLIRYPQEDVLVG